MAAVVQDITAEQGAALAVTFTGAGASLQGRTLRMHVRSKVGVTTTKLVASTTDGRLAVGANPYTTATLAIDADIMAAVSITLPTEYWVYDVESYTTAADVRREWSGRFTISRDVTRDTEATAEASLSGAVLYSGPQSLTTAQKLQARDNIGAGTGSGGGSIDDGDKGDITVSGTGTVWTVDNNAITFAKMQAVSADVLLGNDATGTAVQEIACTAAGRALLDDATAADQRTTLGLGTAATTAATAFEAAGAVSTHAAVTTAHGISAFGATLVDDADAATARTTLGLGSAATSASGDFAAASHAHAASAITSGTLVHERGGLEADVSAYSGLVKITAGATSAVTVTAAGEALLDDADASAQRSTLGLGGAAVLAVGTTAGTVAAGDDSRMTNDRTASGLRTASTVVSVSAATAPSSGQVLTATSSTAANWQTPSGGGTPGGSTTQLQYNNAGAFGGMSGTAWDDTNRSLAITGATVTANKPVFDITQTFSNAAVTMQVVNINLTNTASSPTSAVQQWQVNGTTVARVQKDGSFRATYFMSLSGGIFFYTSGGGCVFYTNTGANLESGGVVSWSNTSGDPSAAIDAQLVRDAANKVAQRRTTNAQTFIVSGTYTDASNYVQGELAATSTAVTLSATTAGTGADNVPVILTPAGTSQVEVGNGVQFTEMTAPSAPAANKVILFAQDNGAGKTQLMALFPSGASQQVAIEP